jgi:hypothetical protein
MRNTNAFEAGSKMPSKPIQIKNKSLPTSGKMLSSSIQRFAQKRYALLKSVNLCHEAIHSFSSLWRNTTHRISSGFSSAQESLFSIVPQRTGTGIGELHDRQHPV